MCRHSFEELNIVWTCAPTLVLRDDSEVTCFMVLLANKDSEAYCGNVVMQYVVFLGSLSYEK